jgi:hypothetical protein
MNMKKPSGILRCVVSSKLTDVSEMRMASIIRAMGDSSLTVAQQCEHLDDTCATIGTRGFRCCEKCDRYGPISYSSRE